MAENKHFIPIWLFIGILLLIYGALILGSGIYDYYNPPAHPRVLAYLHPQIWWGAVVLVIGIVYTVTFRPGKEK